MGRPPPIFYEFTVAAQGKIMKAIWSDEIIAESSDTVVVDGNHYFPRDTLSLNISNRVLTIQYADGKGRHPICRSK